MAESDPASIHGILALGSYIFQEGEIFNAIEQRIADERVEAESLVPRGLYAALTKRRERGVAMGKVGLLDEKLVTLQGQRALLGQLSDGEISVDDYQSASHGHEFMFGLDTYRAAVMMEEFENPSTQG